MNDQAPDVATHEIVIDELFPHPPSAIWKVIATGELMNRWMMAQTGFQPVVGNRFSFQTPPSDEWDGVIRCEVLEVVPNERLAYSWKSGVTSAAGYVPRLDTVVTWTLTRHDGGTRVHLVHSGFVLPRNETVFRNITAGWSRLLPKMAAVAAEQPQSW